MRGTSQKDIFFHFPYIMKNVAGELSPHQNLGEKKNDERKQGLSYPSFYLIQEVVVW